MKKLIAFILLVATSTFAQVRPPKEICSELGSVDRDTGEFVGCTALDSEEVVELKKLFNSLASVLHGQTMLLGNFQSLVVTQRFSDFGRRIAVLERSRDAVVDRDLKKSFQDRIDEATARRDELNSTESGSQRDLASKASSVITRLNAKLDDIETAIRALA